MRYFILSLDTNGLPYNNNFDSVDLVSISLLEVDFLTMDIKREFFSTVKNVKLNGSEKYHGLTQDLIEEYGAESLEDVVVNLIDFLFPNGQFVDFSTIKFIASATSYFTVPMLYKIFSSLELDIDLNNMIDVNDIAKIILFADNLDEAFDIVNVECSPKDSLNKVFAIRELIVKIRKEFYGN